MNPTRLHTQDLLPEACFDSIESAKQHGPEHKYGERGLTLWFVIVKRLDHPGYVTLWLDPNRQGTPITDENGHPLEVAAERIQGKWV